MCRLKTAHNWQEEKEKVEGPHGDSAPCVDLLSGIHGTHREPSGGLHLQWKKGVCGSSFLLGHFRHDHHARWTFLKTTPGFVAIYFCNRYFLRVASDLHPVPD